LKAARRKAGLSQAALGMRLGVSRHAVRQYERGRGVPGSQVLLDMARVLGVAVDYFLRPDPLPRMDRVHWTTSMGPK